MLDSTSIFRLQINPENADYLRETAKWAKFLSIVGFVFCGLIAIAGVAMSSLMSAFGRSFGASAGLGMFMTVFYLGFAALYFFPCLYLYRFADKMKLALAAQDQVTLDDSLMNLKSTFKFVGILMAIMLGFYGLVMLLAVLGGGAALLSR